MAYDVLRYDINICPMWDSVPLHADCKHKWRDYELKNRIIHIKLMTNIVQIWAKKDTGRDSFYVDTMLNFK